jgi:hypothetical protein
MDSIEPDQTPFAAFTAHTSRFQRVSKKLRICALIERVRLVHLNGY